MLRDTIRKDFLDAVKARDTQKAGALRMLEVALKQVEVDTRKTLEDTDVVKILQSELKKRKEAIELYVHGGRQDLADKEQYEADLIQAYLPALASREEIARIVDAVIADSGEAVQFGRVMQKAMAQLAGKADGKAVAEVVKEKLSH
jgi:uncharacterized protein YqeY